MGTERFKILIVEDEAIVAADIQNHLENFGYDVCPLASTGENGLTIAGRERPDLVLMDISLEGDMDGIHAAGQIRRELDIPIVFLTAYTDNDLLERAKRVEPYGYLVKPFKPKELHITIELSLYVAGLDVQRRRAEKLFSTILDSSIDGFWLIDMEGKILEINESYCRLMGYKAEELTGTNIRDLIIEESPEKTADRIQQTRLKRSHQFETRHRRRDGVVVDMEVSATFAQVDGGRIFTFLRDITERKQAEKERNQLIEKLQNALAEIKTLQGLIPICANCKKVRNDEGYWLQIEKYIQERSDVKFSHSICPTCAKKLYPDLF